MADGRQVLLGLSAGVAAVALGALAVLQPVVAVGLVGLGALVAAGRKPLRAAYLWWIGTAIVPVWIGVTAVGFQFLFGTLLAGALLIPVLHVRGIRPRVNGFDVIMVALIASVVIAATFDGSRSLANDAVTHWGLPYLLFRLIALRVSSADLARMIVGVGAFLSAWAVVEYALDWHFYETLPGFGLENLRAIWQSIQIRNGTARSEAAFGTSIALAAFLVIALPFALRSASRRALILGTAIILVGIFATLSRTGFLGVAVVFALVLIARRQRYRVPMALGGLVLGYALLPLVTGEGVTGSTATELAGSSAYRDYVFSTAIPRTEWIGANPFNKGFYVSIDNAYLRVALDSGRIPALLLIALMIYALWVAVRHRPGPATIALVASGASMYVVALITQWELFVFAVAGIAATELQLLRASDGRAGEKVVDEVGHTLMPVR